MPFRRRTLIISVLTFGVALCGVTAYYLQRAFSNVPPPPPTMVSAETREDWAWRFHKVLSKEEKQHVLDGQFMIVFSTQAMPASLKQAFAVVTREREFALANPGEKYQATDVPSESGLPLRRPVFAGVSGNRWLVHYERGGRGHSYEAVVFAREPEGRLQFLWGGGSFDRAKGLDDLCKAIADGRFRDDGAF